MSDNIVPDVDDIESVIIRTQSAMNVAIDKMKTDNIIIDGYGTVKWNPTVGGCDVHLILGTYNKATLTIDSSFSYDFIADVFIDISDFIMYLCYEHLNNPNRQQ